MEITLILIIAAVSVLVFFGILLWRTMRRVKNIPPPLKEYEDAVQKYLTGTVKGELRDIPYIGKKELYLAGAELCVILDFKTVKRMFVAAASTGDCNVYLEMTDNTLGGFHGKITDDWIRSLAQRVVSEAADALPFMDVQGFPPTKPYFVTFFAVGNDGRLYTAQIPNKEIKKGKPFHKFYYVIHGLFNNIKEATRQETPEEAFQKKYGRAGRFLP